MDSPAFHVLMRIGLGLASLTCFWVAGYWVRETYRMRLLEHAVLLLEILDHVQLMAVDPHREYHEQQLKRLKTVGTLQQVYRLTNHRALSSSGPCAFELLDTTPVA